MHRQRQVRVGVVELVANHGGCVQARVHEYLLITHTAIQRRVQGRMARETGWLVRRDALGVVVLKMESCVG